jgi:hypothetical protein
LGLVEGLTTRHCKITACYALLHKASELHGLFERETGFEIWNHVAQDRDQLRALVNTVLKL